MAIVESNRELGRQVAEDAKQFVLHSWSVQDAVNPMPVAGGEGRLVVRAVAQGVERDGVGEGIDPRHRRALGEQSLDEMRTDESRGPGHQRVRTGHFFYGSWGMGGREISRRLPPLSCPATRRWESKSCWTCGSSGWACASRSRYVMARSFCPAWLSA